MPTQKQRIALSLDHDLDRMLRVVAKKSRVPVATKALELLREALELQEDIALSQLASQRLKGKITWLSHEAVWK